MVGWWLRERKQEILIGIVALVVLIALISLIDKDASREDRTQPTPSKPKKLIKVYCTDQFGRGLPEVPVHITEGTDVYGPMTSNEQGIVQFALEAQDDSTFLIYYGDSPTNYGEEFPDSVVIQAGKVEYLIEKQLRAKIEIAVIALSGSHQHPKAGVSVSIRGAKLGVTDTNGQLIVSGDTIPATQNVVAKPTPEEVTIETTASGYTIVLEYGDPTIIPKSTDPPPTIVKSDPPIAWRQFLPEPRTADKPKPVVRSGTTAEPKHTTRPEVDTKPESTVELELAVVSEDYTKHKNEIGELIRGKILFNPPQEMRVGVKERIEARISKMITEDMVTGLRGRGEIQITEVAIGPSMVLRLKGDKFDIEALSHEQQLITKDKFTQWEWDVTPLKSGIHSLSLLVAVRVKIPSHGEETWDYPVLERKIEVKVNPLHSTKQFMKRQWQWIIGTIMTIVVASGIVRQTMARARNRARRKADIDY